MTATPEQFIITDDELTAASSGNYGTLEVPADYDATLVKVEDFDKTAEGKTRGWIFFFDIQGLSFRYYVSKSKAARWKLIETVRAFRPTFFETRAADGTTQVIDPNAWIGEVVGAHVVLDEEMETPLKVIEYLFHQGTTEPGPEAVPTL